MKLVLTEPKLFINGISIVSELVQEVKIVVTPAGLEIVAMDPANVAMVVFRMQPRCFTEYAVQEKEEVAVNLASVKQILKRSRGDDVLTLETTEEAKLQIKMTGKNMRSFSLPTLEIDEKEQKVPDLDFPVKVNTTATMITQAIEDVSVVAESVTFLVDNNKLCVKAEGDLSKAFIEIKPDEETLIDVKGDAKPKAKYSLEYLKKMIAGGKIAEKIELSFNSDYPMKLEYAIPDSISLSFILAPRVEND